LSGAVVKELIRMSEPWRVAGDEQLSSVNELLTNLTDSGASAQIRPQPIPAPPRCSGDPAFTRKLWIASV